MKSYQKIIIILSYWFLTLNLFAQCPGTQFGTFPNTVDGVTVNLTYTGGIVFAGTTYTYCAVVAGPYLMGGGLLAKPLHSLVRLTT